MARPWVTHCTRRIWRSEEMITPDQIASRLPPYYDEWELVKDRQFVPDIIEEICTSHYLFAPYYDEFSLLFYRRTAAEVAEVLYRYCKNFISYKAETVKKQTTALPTGIVYRGQGDCKHYALFTAGVIASLNRLYGCGFTWCFYFAGYNGAEEPYHVFVSLYDPIEREEIWIDPTPGNGGEISVLMPKYL